VSAAPVLLAVGRFVDKKCPDLTIAAFAAAARRHPEARLRMIGDGPLLEPCRALAKRLGVEAQVSFLGPQPPDVVRQQMQHARAFVQHSAEAPTGDSEGLPVSILEASASGLPIISTRHAGIPEVVLENETGVLVDERDIVEMTAAMVRLIEDPALAGRMGEKGRARVAAEFAIERTIGGLWQILSACVN
jgi:glycosyltransferase involved in cell wall biosynthesis